MSSSRSSSPMHLSATTLSWMAKCYLARNIVLSSAGSLSYTTPHTVEKMKSDHDELVKIVRNALIEIFSKHVKGLELEKMKLCLTLMLKDSSYMVCGVPDLAYLLYGVELDDLILLVEVTLSPSIRHLVYGEMLFYSIAAHAYYGCKVAGLIVNLSHVYLILFRENTAKLLRKTFSRKEYEKAVELSESMRAKHPWICSLCDLKHICPLGSEF
ncbi:hypothetical protein [Desulfurococcus sp.]|uniref:hypothetical protein n=1 Tax=Desulfurococcus sp. TaxID=51678 RepID=UPI00319DF1EF